MADVTMPRLSDTMEEGTIASWLKKPGEEIKKGDVIAQIETDKATMDLTAFEAGTLQEILAPEGSTVAIGKPVARIGSGAAAQKSESPAPKAESPAPKSEPAASPPPGAESTGSQQPATPAARENVGEAPEPTASPADQPTMSAETEPAGAGQARASDRTAQGQASDGGAQGQASDRAAQGQASDGGAQAQASDGADGKTRASPMARHIAAEHGLDLARISGSGPQGRVIRSDVEAALSSGAAAPQPTNGAASAQAAPQASGAAAQAAPGAAGEDDERVTLSQMRRTIARRMAESTRTVPHFFLTATVDASELVKLRKQIMDQLADSGVKITFNDLVVKAAALAIRKVPEVNVSFADDSLIKHHRVHIGVAVATERGLIVPVVRDVDQKTLSQIARETRDLAERAGSGKLQPAEYSGGTFTISNLGMFGIEQFNAVINPPEAAILAVGAITREPAEHDGEVVLRERMKLTLSVDHRALDGAIGARYLQALKQLLEKPMLVVV